MELRGCSQSAFKSHFLIDKGSEFMASSESSNNTLLFIKFRKIDIPKVKEMGGILKFQRAHKSPPSSSPILSKYDS